MSGGRYNYFYSKLDDFASEIDHYTDEEKTLNTFLLDLTEVLYEYEMWKSGDTSEDDFLEMFYEFKNKWLKEVKNENYSNLGKKKGN